MSKAKLPLVSVLMTVYNARPFLRESVSSILSQTYKNLELIVVDDGSDDGSTEIIKSFSKRSRRVKTVFLKKNVGPSHASNAGLKITKGMYIARMDADDISYPDRIERQVRFLEKHSDVVLLGGQCRLIDKNGEVVGVKRFPAEHDDIYRSLFKINPIQHPSCMINCNLFDKKKLSYKNHFLLAHDLELVFDLARYGKLANLGSEILFYRQYPSSLSLKDPKETFKATLRIRKKAVKIYGYKPEIQGRLFNFLQTLIVAVLPGRIIYPVYALMRNSHKLNVKLNMNVNFIFKKAFALVKV